MGRTPDAYDGPRIDEAVIWEEQASDPTEARKVQYVTGKGLVILEDGVVHAVGEGRESYFQPPVDDRDVNTPPVGPATGYRVIIGDSPTGDFVGHAGEIAQYDGSAWVFTAPKQGTHVFVKDEEADYQQEAASSPWTWAKPTGSGLSEAQHRTLRQLIHFISDGPAEGFATGAYKETLPAASPFPTSVTWWESSSKLKKIVERLVTWTGANPTTDQWKIYDTDGTTVLWIVTDTISYSGIFETSRTRAIAAGP
jgi:hypothetical protein